MKDILFLLQRVGALCNAIRDCRPKIRTDIRTEASAILRDVEHAIAAMPEDDKPQEKTSQE